MSATNFLAAISIHLYLYCSIKYIKQWGSVIVNNSPTSPSHFQLSFKGTAIGGLRYKKAARIVSGLLEEYE